VWPSSDLLSLRGPVRQPFSQGKVGYWSLPTHHREVLQGFFATLTGADEKRDFSNSQSRLVYMVVSPPGIGTCGKSVANILFDACSKPEFPKAVQDGWAQPILPAFTDASKQKVLHYSLRTTPLLHFSTTPHSILHGSYSLRLLPTSVLSSFLTVGHNWPWLVLAHHSSP
jgi:hypothetical protein